jgi:hypothetical protein
MRKFRLFFFMLIPTLLYASCKSPVAVIPEQQYTIVEAQRRLYNASDGRNYTEYELFETRTIENLAGYVPPKELQPTSRYGGWLKHQTTATGFFYVTYLEGRWWGVDPLGYLYINSAMNSLRPGTSERNREALIDKFGSHQQWMNQTIAMLQEFGFNSAGSWSDHQAIIETNTTAQRPFAYTINWNFMSSYGRERGGTYQRPGNIGYPNQAIFVFDPGFEEFCDRHAQQLLQYKDDPNLYGYFSDNEMPFRISALTDFYTLPAHEPGHKHAREWLKSKGITIEEATDEHRDEFLAHVADRYFSIVSAAIRKYDPNHMFLGARFHGGERNRQRFMETVGQYLDIVSVNYYNEWTPRKQHLENYTLWSGRPVIITEYYTKGEDSGMTNQSGAGWIVKTQRDRGLFYQNFNLALLESPNCVGWHYFKYQDNDPTATGVDPSNIDGNKGIVNNYYDVWSDMVDKMQELNLQVYDIIQHFNQKK